MMPDNSFLFHELVIETFNLCEAKSGSKMKLGVNF
jgi:hypothetical protein